MRMKEKLKDRSKTESGVFSSCNEALIQRKSDKNKFLKNSTQGILVYPERKA